LEIRKGGDSGIPVVVAEPQAPPSQSFVEIAKVLRKTLS
jgi:MinD-like ATPase involved in chromosome partitioning or flagellar assembly